MDIKIEGHFIPFVTFILLTNATFIYLQKVGVNSTLIPCSVLDEGVP